MSILLSTNEFEEATREAIAVAFEHREGPNLRICVRRSDIADELLIAIGPVRSGRFEEFAIPARLIPAGDPYETVKPGVAEALRKLGYHVSPQLLTGQLKVERLALAPPLIPPDAPRAADTSLSADLAAERVTLIRDIVARDADVARLRRRLAMVDAMLEQVKA